jgi:hypothetical protein
MIIVVIWMEYISLCFSKMPVQTYSYTLRVSTLMMWPSRCCTSLLLGACLSAKMKTSR